MPVARRPSSISRGRGATTFEYGAAFHYPQPPQPRNQRMLQEPRRPHPGYSNNVGGYEPRRPDGPRPEGYPLETGNAARVWNAFAFGLPPEEVNSASFRQGREDQHNLGDLARNMPRTDPRGRPTPGLTQSRALPPPTRPAMLTSSASPTYPRPPVSTPSPVPATRATRPVPQESGWSDAGTVRPLGQTKEPVRTTSASPRNESTPVNTDDTTKESTATQVAIETLISITPGPDADKGDVQHVDTSNSRESDPMNQSFVSDLVADLLDLDFTLGGTVDTTEKDWSPARNQESEAILIDFSSPDPDVDSTATPSSVYIDSLFDSMDQQQIVADLIGTRDQSAQGLANHQFTNGADREAVAAMVDSSDQEDIQELYGLKAAWEAEDNDHPSDIYSTDIESGSDSGGDSDDSEATNGDPWRTLGGDEIFLGMDDLEKIRKGLQGATWEQLFETVKI